MHYFVTGGTGFIGGRLITQLREAGHAVTALARTPDAAQHLVDQGVTVVKGDITDRASLRAPMEGVDGVFHLAAWYQIGATRTEQERRAEQINVEGTRNVLETMRELAIPKGVYTSTLAVFSDTHGREVDETYRHDGPHLSVYDRTKWEAHYEVAEPLIAEGLPLVIVQPGLVYGPGDTSAVADTFRQYLRGRLPVLPLETAYSWGHVDDIARAHVLAMERGTAGESYIIGGPSHTLVDAFHIAEQITGIAPPRVRVGPGPLRAMARMMKVVEKAVPVPDTYTAEGLRVTAGVTYLGDNRKAREELGYAPRPLDDGLAATLPVLMREMGLQRRVGD